MSVVLALALCLSGIPAAPVFANEIALQMDPAAERPEVPAAEVADELSDDSETQQAGPSSGPLEALEKPLAAVTSAGQDLEQAPAPNPSPTPRGPYETRVYGSKHWTDTVNGTDYEGLQEWYTITIYDEDDNVVSTTDQIFHLVHTRGFSDGKVSGHERTETTWTYDPDGNIETVTTDIEVDAAVARWLNDAHTGYELGGLSYRIHIGPDGSSIDGSGFYKKVHSAFGETLQQPWIDLEADGDITLGPIVIIVHEEDLEAVFDPVTFSYSWRNKVYHPSVLPEGE